MTPVGLDGYVVVKLESAAANFGTLMQPLGDLSAGTTIIFLDLLMDFSVDNNRFAVVEESSIVAKVISSS